MRELRQPFPHRWGKPVEGARVFFHPEEQAKDRFLPNAITGTGGVFQLTTYQPDDGAPAGRYKVSVALGAGGDKATDDPEVKAPAIKSAAAPPGLPEKYSDPKTSELSAEIRSDTPNKLHFDLK